MVEIPNCNLKSLKKLGEKIEKNVLHTQQKTVCHMGIKEK